MALSQRAFYSDLGANIRRARLKANLTQQELSESLGLTRTSITNIEKGRQPIQLHALAQLSVTLGVRLGELVPELQPSAGLQHYLDALPSEKRHWVSQIVSNQIRRPGGA